MSHTANIDDLFNEGTKIRRCLKASWTPDVLLSYRWRSGSPDYLRTATDPHNADNDSPFYINFVPKIVYFKFYINLSVNI